MFEYLRALGRRIMQREFGPLLPPPDDPHVGVREPRRRGPGDRSSAVAVDEPREPVIVRAAGTIVNRPPIRHHTDP
jgi:hypothetical protein